MGTAALDLIAYLQHEIQRSGVSMDGTNEMVERVAAAIVTAGKEWLKETNDDTLGWGDVPDEVFAVAAIEAMRSPTEAMIEASNREWDGRMSHRSSGAWQAMIDAALK